MNALLELRKRMNKKRPSFTIKDSALNKRVDGSRWRKPKGLHNKTRRQFAGKPSVVKVGYRNPAAIRGLDAKGLNPVLVHTPTALAALDPKKHSVIIASVGNKKKAALIDLCAEKKLTIINMRDPKETRAAIQETLETRKKKRAERTKKITEQKTKKQEQKEEKTAPEDTKKQEQKEMEKLVTKRDA